MESPPNQMQTLSHPDLSPSLGAIQHAGMPESEPAAASVGPRRKAREFRAQDPETYAYLDRAIRRACPAWLTHMVDDVSQKAALKVYRILNSEEGPAHVSGAYLYRVASTVLVDEIRQARRKTHQTDQLDERREFSLGESASYQSPERAMSSAELGNEILDCMSKLLRDRRMALSMKLQGYSNRESAQKLGWGEKKTENLSTRGRQDLRDCLEKKEIRSHA